MWSYYVLFFAVLLSTQLAFGFYFHAHVPWMVIFIIPCLNCNYLTFQCNLSWSQIYFYFQSVTETVESKRRLMNAIFCLGMDANAPKYSIKCMVVLGSHWNSLSVGIVANVVSKTSASSYRKLRNKLGSQIHSGSTLFFFFFPLLLGFIFMFQWCLSRYERIQMHPCRMRSVDKQVRKIYLE
jgi:hypothetical protein